VVLLLTELLNGGKTIASAKVFVQEKHTHKTILGKAYVPKESPPTAPKPRLSVGNLRRPMDFIVDIEVPSKRRNQPK
jgi:hypothetical protein